VVRDEPSDGVLGSITVELNIEVEALSSAKDMRACPLVLLSVSFTSHPVSASAPRKHLLIVALLVEYLEGSEPTIPMYQQH
jgi:hypothetical protein